MFQDPKWGFNLNFGNLCSRLKDDASLCWVALFSTFSKSFRYFNLLKVQELDPKLQPRKKKLLLKKLKVVDNFCTKPSPHQSPCSRTWQQDHTCAWRPRSSSRRSCPCSPCRHRSATARGCRGRPSDTETRRRDNRRADAWLKGGVAEYKRKRKKKRSAFWKKMWSLNNRSEPTFRRWLF